MKKCLTLISAGVLWTLSAGAGGHPTSVGVGDAPVWFAASEVLHRDGSLKDARWMSEAFREQVRKQSVAFAQRFPFPPEGVDLEDGSRPPRELCVGVPALDPERVGSVLANWRYDPQIEDFDLTVLTSEVAVEATVSALIPGFRLRGASVEGDPGLLLELSEVVPLHRRSALPSYTLIPTDQVMIRGRAFCADELVQEYPYERPEVGDRVVLIGSLWPGDEVVRAWHPKGGRFAVTRGEKDGEVFLDWSTGFEGALGEGVASTPTQATPGDTLFGLYRHMEGLEASGLFEWVEYVLPNPHAQAVVPNPYGESEVRARFFRSWNDFREAGCQPTRWSRAPDGTMSLHSNCNLPVATPLRALAIKNSTKENPGR